MFASLPRIVDSNVNSAAEYAAAGNNKMVTKHAEIALLAAQEVGGLDALLRSVKPGKYTEYVSLQYTSQAQ